MIDGRVMSADQSSHGAALEAATSSVQEALIDLHGLPVEVAKIAVQALLKTVSVEGLHVGLCPMCPVFPPCSLDATD